jgi:hypothetical protein
LNAHAKPEGCQLKMRLSRLCVAAAHRCGDHQVPQYIE